MSEAVAQAVTATEAERSVIAGILATPKLAGEVVATMLQPQHFADAALRRIYRTISDAYYGDDPIDPLTVGSLCSAELARIWRCEEPEAISRVQSLATHGGSDPVAHARLVKRDSDYRDLLEVAADLARSVDSKAQEPTDLAGRVAQRTTRIATSTLLTNEVMSFADVGRAFVAHQRRLMAARKQGIELGAYFGLPFVDRYVRGLQPTELFFLAGEPGAGKSALVYKMAQKFAERQDQRPVDEQVGTLVLSLEMGCDTSAARLAQSVAQIDGGKLREGRTTDAELDSIIEGWRKLKSLPLYFNFTSTLRAGQMRAMIVEAIRRHNVGLVVIDHFRYFDMDRKYDRQLEEDEDKARFLKEDIAKELNVAVICLAHTTKGIEHSEGRRPTLSHLRGSGQVAAHADFVAFVHRPYKHATQKEIDEGTVLRTDAELIYEKNRHGLDGSVGFFFEPSTMHIV